MTIEEKRRAIEDYCIAYGASCDGCPLQYVTTGQYCYSPSDDPRKDADVERNYRILFGNLEAADHPNCSLQPPASDPAGYTAAQPGTGCGEGRSGRSEGGRIDITLNVDTSGLDAAIEKANRLVELLESASDLLNRIAQKA